MNKDNLYAFYGSLRPGEYNFERFQDAYNKPLNPVENLQKVRVPGFSLYSLGSYPCIVRDEENKEGIVVDVVKITNPNTEKSIHAMEIMAGYNYEEININEKTVGIYVFDSAPTRAPKVSSGDWSEFLHQRSGK